MRKSVLAVVALVVVGGTACGGGSSSPTTGGGGSSSSPSPCLFGTPTDLTGDNPFTITMTDQYEPFCFSATNNSTIKLVNQDYVSHTFTIIDTGVDVLIKAGKTVTKPAANLAPGTYDFHCTMHPEMNGIMIVVAA